MVLIWFALMVLINMGPRQEGFDPVEVAPAVSGRWLAMNSPGQALPSHGVRKLGQLSAIDIIHPSDQRGEGQVNPAKMTRSLRGSRPERFSCFGEPVLSMADGVVVEVADRQPDQRARNSWPSFLWFSTLENLFRTLAGPWAVIGNRVIVRHDDGVHAAYAHLRKGSVKVAVGDRVEVGQALAEVGNTGNTTQPHLHVQLMDRSRAEAAAGVPMLWSGITCEEIDPEWQRFAKEPAGSALRDMPRNGQVFQAAPPPG